MKQRLKGLLALVLSLVMVFALATNAWATVSIGGQELASGVAFSGAQGTATYNDATSTLTLENFAYNGSDGITATDSLTIVLEGENTITTTSDKGIKVSGDLTINGTGVLTAVGDKYGLSASNITISGGTVKATGKTHGIFAYNDGHSGGMKVTISGGSVEAYADDGSDGIGIYAPSGEIAISGTNTEVTVGCATGLKASTVNILENSTVNITTNATTFTDGKTIDCTNLYFDADTSKLGTWYQWSENGGSVNISSNTNQLTVDAAKGVQTLTIEKISTGGQGTATPQPPTYYPIYIPTVEDEPEVTAPNTFDGGIASAVVVTILSATGGAWLAKKKD